jgi:hypothetical protein
MFSNFIQLGIGLMILMLLTLLGFGGLQWLHIPVGNLLDWIIGGASFWWLLVIVTVPWNIYFQAKETLADAKLSAEKGLTIRADELRYVGKLAERSRLIAIALHILSAICLYTLSATGISAVGYIGSVAALLLTALRPAIGAYHYFTTRLALIRNGFIYPREDSSELRSRLTALETTVMRLNDQMNPELSYSWAATQQHHWEELRKDLARLSAAQADLEATNQRDHDRLGREAKQAIAQLTMDGQFLDHVREIIRFFKTA